MSIGQDGSRAKWTHSSFDFATFQSLCRDLLVVTGHQVDCLIGPSDFPNFTVRLSVLYVQDESLDRPCARQGQSLSVRASLDLQPNVRELDILPWLRPVGCGNTFTSALHWSFKEMSRQHTISSQDFPVVIDQPRSYHNDLGELCS